MVAPPASSATAGPNYRGDGTVAGTTSMATPRQRSPAAITRIRTRNRRKRYLDLHPEYFSSSLELADPLAYDRLVRRFQTAAEREEEEGKMKGYSGILEADLWRSEAKIEALKNPTTALLMTYKRGKHGEIIAEEKDDVPMTKEEGMLRWRKEMELRFLEGHDEDFEYSMVDRSEEYDDRRLEEREGEEKWFDEEDPRWVTDLTEEHVEGETGVQDF